MISIEFDDGGSKQSFELLADSFSELRPVFAKFTAYMRGQVDEVFRTGGNGEWPARSEVHDQRANANKQARIARVRANQFNSLRGALRSERRKAERRYAKSKKSVLLELAGVESKLTAKRRKSLERYEAQQRELERLQVGGSKDNPAYKKFYERVERREQRAQRKIESIERGEQLGQVAHSFSVLFDKQGWEMFSRIPWAGAHNEGATVGYGATLPARTFLTWTMPRLEKFVEMANAYFIERAEKAARK